MPLPRKFRHWLRRAVAPGVRRIATPQAVAYLQDVAAPRMRLAPSGDFERVRAGANTAVIRWRTAAGDVLYARVWPWKRKHSPVRQHREAARLLRSVGLRTPELLFDDDSTALVAQWGVEVVVEREAPGIPLSRLGAHRQQAYGAVVRDLARLHALEGPAWHRPWLGDQGDKNPLPAWHERLARFRERVTPRNSSLSDAEIESSLRLLERGLRRAARRPPVLVHGDVSPGHLYVDEAGALTWIDLETVHYGAAEEDLAAAARWIDPRHLPAFLQAYAKARGRAVDPEALRTFRLLFEWERLNSRVQQARRRTGRDASGRKNPAKLAKDRLAAESAIRHLLSEGGADPGVDPSATRGSEPTAETANP